MWSVSFKKSCADEVFALLDEKFSKVGNIVTGFRLRDGLTQAQLARKLKVHQTTVAAIEVGRRRVGKTMALKLGEIFKTNLAVFLSK